MLDGYKLYCKEYWKIENYDLAKSDNFEGWHCHHKLGIDYSREELTNFDLYFDRPYFELIFMKKEEHRALHMKNNTYFSGKTHTDTYKKLMHEKMKGRKLSEETRKKISEARKGKTQNISVEGRERKRQATIKYNKTRIISLETRKKISESLKGHIPWNKGLKMNREEL